MVRGSVFDNLNWLYIVFPAGYSATDFSSFKKAPRLVYCP